MKNRVLYTPLLWATAFACAPASSDTPQPTAAFSTTPAAIASSNLDAQIAGYIAAWERNPIPPHAGAAVDLLLARSQYRGSFSDYDRAVEIATHTFERYPENSDSLALRATVQASLHHFDAAREDLAILSAAGVDVSARDASLALALGEEPTVLTDYLVNRAQQIPTFQTLTAAAAGLVATGEFEAADAMFAAAADGYRDVSPFPLAWVDFQRGLLWAESADDGDRARPFYEAAVARVPFYVVANVHLAELEFETGEAQRAIWRLENLVISVEDPEPASRLAQFLAEHRPARAAYFAGVAESKYDALLEKYPLAFADHASEFFAGQGGDPLRALELALLNLDNRSTERALQLALDAAFAADDAVVLCSLYDEGRSQTRYSLNLQAALEGIGGRCD